MSSDQILENFPTLPLQISMKLCIKVPQHLLISYPELNLHMCIGCESMGPFVKGTLTLDRDASCDGFNPILHQQVLLNPNT